MVEVRLNTVLKGYDDKMVTFADGSQEYWETLIWTAGVRGEPMPGLDAAHIGPGNRIIVDDHNRLQGRDNVFALGDICLMTSDKYPKGHPQVAQVAIQQARNLARTFNHPDKALPFVYNDKGSMATVGKNLAVCNLGKHFLSGRVAWWVWMFIHLISIMGMRNKLNVMLNWIWNYVTYSTSLRLLLRPAKYPQRRHWGD